MSNDQLLTSVVDTALQAAGRCHVQMLQMMYKAEQTPTLTALYSVVLNALVSGIAACCPDHFAAIERILFARAVSALINDQKQQFTLLFPPSLAFFVLR